MEPAAAMGTFLRIWRSEWAGLSRAQLATCLRALSPGARGITPRVIRRWEEGQPPATTEELEALLAAMRRHGLTRPETEHFRRSVYAACVGRQYRELFAEDSFAARPDVDEAAHHRFIGTPFFHWEGGVVQAVACMEDLNSAMSGRAYLAVEASHERRQEEACVYLHLALSTAHGNAYRFRLALQELAAASELVAARFGGRLSPGLTTDVLLVKSLHGSAYLTKSDAVLPKLLALHEQALATGDLHLRQLAIQSAVDCLPQVSPDDWPDALRNLEADQFAAAAAGCNTYMLAEAHYMQAGAAMELGAFADTDRHYEGFDHWRNSVDLNDVRRWQAAHGGYAFRRGDLGEAACHLEKAAALSDVLGDHPFAESCRGGLRWCEDQQRRANLRKSRSSSAE